MTAVDPHLRATKTTCAYCGVGCGVWRRPMAGEGLRSRADPEHPPISAGCARRDRRSARRSAWENRLLHPMIRCERAAWSGLRGAMRSTMSRIVFSTSSRATAPVRSPFISPASLLTEDYYVANKLMKGFVGSANVDTIRAVHGLVCRRPPPRVRYRHGAGLLRRSRRG